MKAAIYARKSTEQKGVCDEQKSVRRQIVGAHAFAAQKGWDVAQRHVYADDGYSGAEFSARPGLVAMMAAAAQAEFNTLIISEDSRIGREQIETAWVLKQLDMSGVTVVAYSDGRERTVTTPIDKIMRSFNAFADEQERERARQRTHAAMIRKAQMGHVTGGRVFGYTNVSVYASNDARQHGEPTHKVHQINEPEAVVVRRIFALIGEGYGLKTVAKTLNGEGVPTPRPQLGRPAGWVASSLLAILQRDQYRGEIVYNKTRKRDAWGQQNQQPRPESEWIRVPMPHLRIVTDEQWECAQQQRASKRKVFGPKTSGRLQHGPTDGGESKYLLPGLARCAGCNGTIHVRSRSHGRQRAHHYGCSANHARGSKICANSAVVPMADADAAIINSIESAVMNGAVVERTARLVRERLQSWQPTATASRSTLVAEAALVEVEISNVMRFIRTGVQSKAVAAELAELESKLFAIEKRISACDAHVAVRIDADFDARVAAKIRDWRTVLAGNVAPTRALLRKLLDGPIVLTALTGKIGYRFDGKIKLDELMALGGALSMASPTGFEPVF
jgi:site-specific DNA recombinase